MLLKHIEIGCRNYSQAKQIFTSNFAFCVLHEENNSCLLKSNNIKLFLKNQPSDVSRVANISFSCANLQHVRKNLSSLKIKCSEIRDNCPHHPDVPFFDVLSPFSTLEHRVFEAPPCHESLMSDDIDHFLFCCDKKTARLHAQWYAQLLNVDPYPLAGSESGAMKVEVNGSGMEMFVNCGKETGLPIFAFSEPITTNSVVLYNQIERFLRANQGGGVQHIGLKSSNIFQTVSELRERGVRVIEQPISYYTLDEKLAQFQELNIDPQIAFENSIIVDKDDDGYLLQVFTESLLEKDGLFLEIIERRGSRGFGTGNVRALFAALQKKMQSTSAS